MNGPKEADRPEPGMILTLQLLPYQPLTQSKESLHLARKDFAWSDRVMGRSELAGALSRRNAAGIEKETQMQTRNIACALMIAGIAGMTGVVGGCATPSGQTTSERQASTLLMRDQALARLERERPEAKAALQSAAGYAVFQTIAMGAGIGGSNGFGVAEAHNTGKQTFMRMSSNSLNAGVSAQENRLVLIFRDQAAFDRFVAGNWQWGGTASAGASSSNGGGGTGNSTNTSTDGVTVYQMTSAGFALTANLGAARFWPDANM